jgi:hypothetical protein
MTSVLPRLARGLTLLSQNRVPHDEKFVSIQRESLC